MNHALRQSRLQALLLAHQDLWRPQPFKLHTPAWCERHTALAHALLTVHDDEVDALAGDDVAMIRLLAGHLPALAELAPLIDLPIHAVDSRPPLPAHLDRDIPGRKLQQIQAFTAAIEPADQPVLEWCAGKGHLGRLLAQAWRVRVTSLEIDAALCAAGADLARHGQVEDRQHFLRADALAADSARHLAGQHAVALHACGELHRALIDGAIGAASPALDLAPCCYYRTREAVYHPYCDGELVLHHDDLRLAVTDSVTAPPRLRRRARQAMAWKLAYQELQRRASLCAAYHPLKPVPEVWMQQGFVAWCRRVAQREGLILRDEPDWATLETQAWQRTHRVRRLELARLAFRRALEVWLVTDMATHLEAHGYRVALATFCPRPLTPRNLLLSARRN